MDIKELDTRAIHGAGAELQVKDQLGKDTDVYIKVAGVDSKLWRETIKGNARKTGDDKLSDNEILAKICLGFRGLESDGKEVPFSYESMLNLLEIAPYIAEQIDRFIGNRANFTKG